MTINLLTICTKISVRRILKILPKVWRTRCFQNVRLEPIQSIILYILNILNIFQLSEDTGYVLYSAFGSFYIPSCIMVFVYINIYVAARYKQPQKFKNSNDLMTLTRWTFFRDKLEMSILLEKTLTLSRTYDPLTIH